jgi:hypothetical protein
MQLALRYTAIREDLAYNGVKIWLWTYETDIILVSLIYYSSNSREELQQTLDYGNDADILDQVNVWVEYIAEILLVIVNLIKLPAGK